MTIATPADLLAIERDDHLPPGLAAPLVALWWDARGDWDRAHHVVQEIDNDDGSWVHAYLHRKEGDAANAAYWYRRAGRPTFNGALHAEWQEIVNELLDRGRRRVRDHDTT